MTQDVTFRVTAQHLLLLQHMYVSWDDMEYGAPCIDPKRPYGNSDVEEDICDILELPKVRDPRHFDALVYALETTQEAARLHRQMEVALQIVLCTQSFRTGVYQLTSRYDVRLWVFVHE